MPQDISRLESLKALDISNNELSGEIPGWMGSLKALASFKASSNKFSGQLYDFADMPLLTYVDLSNNALVGTIPPTMLMNTDTSKKVFLSLSNNRLTGEIPGNLAAIPKLSLNVANNEITSIGDGLCSMSSWNELDVSYFGCDGIACPIGTSSSAGRQTGEDHPCSPCAKAEFMGSTVCAASNAVSSRPVVSLLFGTFVGMMAVFA